MELSSFDPPDLPDEVVARIADELYGVVGEQARLRGERSHNTRITTPDRHDYVLRVASAHEPDDAIDFHADALIHLERRAPELPVARVLAARSGQLVPTIELAGEHHRVRMETFLPGVTFDDDQIVSGPALASIGEVLGAIAVALEDFDRPVGHEFMPWDIANGLIMHPTLRSALRSPAAELVALAEPRLERAGDAMAVLPRQTVHNDAHAGNLLRSDPTSEELVGVIDFGDLVHTVTIADIAVCGASLVPLHTDPVAALAALAAGYHRSRPLTSDEIAAVPDLLLARLVLSTLLARYQIDHAPHLAEVVSAERPGLLARLAGWLDIDPLRAVDAIAEACGA